VHFHPGVAGAQMGFRDLLQLVLIKWADPVCGYMGLPVAWRGARVTGREAAAVAAGGGREGSGDGMQERIPGANTTV
jgi:hypothetical protein